MQRIQRTLQTPRSAAATRAEVPASNALLRLAVLATAMLLTFLAAARAGASQVADARPAARVADSAGAAAMATAPTPSPRLAPDDVVGIVLDALSQNDTPVKDRGISVTFSFSSPANRAFVGPLESFGDLVRDDAYRPLLYHRRAARGLARVTGDRATERVVITTAHGDRVAYVFTLSLQSNGAYKGCWMTDGVTREAPSPLQGMRFAN